MKQRFHDFLMVSWALKLHDESFEKLIESANTGNHKATCELYLDNLVISVVSDP